MHPSAAPRSEQRQHLNISNKAYETLISDIDAFSESGGLSGFINRILSNDTPSYGSGKITAKEKKNILDAINQKSIPYILDDVRDFEIEFTPEGIKAYRSTLHLRPVADVSMTKKLASGNQIMHFRATYRQIKNYFFKFGKDARIVSPIEASESFKNSYLQAYEKYR